MTEEVVIESTETQAREDASAAEIKEAVLDIKSEVRDITDQSELADRVAEKVLSSLKVLFEQQSQASNEPEPPPEASVATTPEEEDVAPKRSHRLFRKIGKREE